MKQIRLGEQMKIELWESEQGWIWIPSASSRVYIGGFAEYITRIHNDEIRMFSPNIGGGDSLYEEKRKSDRNKKRQQRAEKAARSETSASRGKARSSARRSARSKLGRIQSSSGGASALPV